MGDFRLQLYQYYTPVAFNTLCFASINSEIIVSASLCCPTGVVSKLRQAQKGNTGPSVIQTQIRQSL
jgi:hypothetical protein